MATPSRPPSGARSHPAGLSLKDIAARITDRFDVHTDIARGELTVFIAPGQVREVLAFCRDDEALHCRLLADLSGVHWPGGEQVVERQVSTTGWPEYRASRDRGVIEVSYILRSLAKRHWFRVAVAVDDDDPRLPSVTGLFPTANYHEREVYDLFGVDFTGHPALTRILMPDDWVGHPLRKDYPLGGVDVPYHGGKFIPPPDRRDLREMVE